MLGQCITILADKACGKRVKEVVPFRNSSLTRILQNALGGNSKTIMICAISPAWLNYEETLGTLRYADNAKKIQNKAVINESVQDRMIRELKEENGKLKEMLKKLSQQSASGQPVDLAALGMNNLSEIIDDMQENEKILEDFQKPWAEKLAEAKVNEGRDDELPEKADEEVKEEAIVVDSPAKKTVTMEDAMADVDANFEGDRRKSVDRKSFLTGRSSMRKSRRMTGPINDVQQPHLTNLHEDDQLNGIIFYDLSSGEIHIGRKSGNPVPKIILAATKIKPNHAKICLLDNGLFELTACDSEAASFTYVNGKPLPAKKRSRILQHLDRISFAGGHIYLFQYPLLAHKINQLVAENAAENEGVELSLQK